MQTTMMTVTGSLRRVMLREPAQLARLEPTRELVARLPQLLRPFQARWVLRCGKKELEVLRAEHPEMVGPRHGERGHWRYVRELVAGMARV